MGIVGEILLVALLVFVVGFLFSAGRCLAELLFIRFDR